jgi:hypothetical protein
MAANLAASALSTNGSERGYPRHTSNAQHKWGHPKNARYGRPCPRCHQPGTFAANSIVCQRCMDTRPLLITVAVTIAFAVTGGDR